MRWFQKCYRFFPASHDITGNAKKSKFFEENQDF